MRGCSSRTSAGVTRRSGIQMLSSSEDMATLGTKARVSSAKNAAAINFFPSKGRTKIRAKSL